MGKSFGLLVTSTALCSPRGPGDEAVGLVESDPARGEIASPLAGSPSDSPTDGEDGQAVEQ